MQGLFAAIFLAVSLVGSPQVERGQVVYTHHTHSHCVVEVEEHSLARASSFRAVCSKGDLNSVFNNRADAVKAAQNHQKATGHTTSVRKQ